MLCIPPYKSSDDVDSGLLSNAATLCESRRAMCWWTRLAPGTRLRKRSQGSVRWEPTVPMLLSFSLASSNPTPCTTTIPPTFVPCGVVAGIFARTDAQRGVWKAPAGLEATLVGVPQLNLA